MKNVLLAISILMLVSSGCRKEAANQENIVIPETNSNETVLINSKEFTNPKKNITFSELKDNDSFKNIFFFYPEYLPNNYEIANDSINIRYYLNQKSFSEASIPSDNKRDEFENEFAIYSLEQNYDENVKSASIMSLNGEREAIVFYNRFESLENIKELSMKELIKYNVLYKTEEKDYEEVASDLFEKAFITRTVHDNNGGTYDNNNVGFLTFTGLNELNQYIPYLDTTNNTKNVDIKDMRSLEKKYTHSVFSIQCQYSTNGYDEAYSELIKIVENLKPLD